MVYDLDLSTEGWVAASKLNWDLHDCNMCFSSHLGVVTVGSCGACTRACETYKELQICIVT